MGSRGHDDRHGRDVEEEGGDLDNEIIDPHGLDDCTGGRAWDEGPVGEVVELDAVDAGVGHRKRTERPQAGTEDAEGPARVLFSLARGGWRTARSAPADRGDAEDGGEARSRRGPYLDNSPPAQTGRE